MLKHAHAALTGALYSYTGLCYGHAHCTPDASSLDSAWILSHMTSSCFSARRIPFRARWSHFRSKSMTFIVNIVLPGSGLGAAGPGAGLGPQPRPQATNVAVAVVLVLGVGGWQADASLCFTRGSTRDREQNVVARTCSNDSHLVNPYSSECLSNRCQDLSS